MTKANKALVEHLYTNEGAGGEVYNTLSYIEASQHDSNVLWTGSDCGLVHVTTDGGKNWTDVTPPNVGEALINAIDVSPHNPSACVCDNNKIQV